MGQANISPLYHCRTEGKLQPIYTSFLPTTCFHLVIRNRDWEKKEGWLFLPVERSFPIVPKVLYTEQVLQWIREEDRATCEHFNWLWINIYQCICHVLWSAMVKGFPKTVLAPQSYLIINAFSSHKDQCNNNNIDDNQELFHK